MAKSFVFSLNREQSHAQPLQLLSRQIRSGAAPAVVEKLLFTEMPRSAQGVAARRARQTQELVRLSLGGQLKHRPLCRRGTLCLTARSLNSSMKTSSHLEKIGKLEQLRGRLDPADDFELWFWAGMTAGTHAVNAALHHARITSDDDIFPIQPGVYLVPEPNGSLTPAFRPLGDVLHVGRPKIEAPVPEDVAVMMHEMEIVEQHRDPCVRDRREPTRDIIEECDSALSRCLKLLRQRISAVTP
jgi:hypothetical protein